jgi:DNA-binding NarL/FixJ family response regulator
MSCSVLLVEPQFLMRRTVATVARQLQLADIEEATSHEMALRRLQEKHFDALLADIGDGVEGISLVQRVRGGAAGCAAGLPIALMAGSCDAGTIALFKTLDVRRIMLKPFKVRTAIEVLASLAGKSLPP